MDSEERLKNLIALVQEEFIGLRESDLILLLASIVGMVQQEEIETKPDEQISEPLIEIPASLVRFLCTKPEVANFIEPCGVRFDRCRVDGELDLACIKMAFPLKFTNCQFLNGIKLSESQTRTLVFIGIVCDSFDANGLDVRGNLQVKLSRIGKTVKLRGAKIRGDLIFEGSALGLHKNNSHENDEGNAEISEKRAIDLDKADIGGSLNLNDGFHAIGEVNLRGIRIRGNLRCEGGHFDGSTDEEDDRENELYALIANQAIIGRNVYLRNAQGKPCCVIGHILMLEALIKGDLDCTGGSFSHTRGNHHAISIDRSHIRGSIYLRNGFEAIGSVRLIGTTIDGDLDCSAGGFYRSSKTDDHDGAITLDVRRGKIGCSAFLCKQLIGIGSSTFSTDGLIDFSGARIAADVNCEDANFDIQAPLGMIGLKLRGAKVGGKIIWKNVKLNQFTDTYLKLEDATARRFELCARQEEPHQDALKKLKIEIDGFIYNSITGCLKTQDALLWLGLQAPFKTQPYEQLAAVMRQTGHDGIARDILEAKVDRHREFQVQQVMGADIPKEIKWVLKMIFAVKIMFWHLHKFSVGNGYHSLWALRLVIPIFLLGWISSHFAYSNDLMVPTETKACMEWVENVANGSHAGVANLPSFNSLAYTLDGFLPGIDLDQEKNWRPIREPFLLEGKEYITSNLPLGTNRNQPVEACVVRPGLIKLLDTPKNWIIGFVIRYVWPFGILLSWFLIGLVIFGPAGVVKKI